MLDLLELQVGGVHAESVSLKCQPSECDLHGGGITSPILLFAGTNSSSSSTPEREMAVWVISRWVDRALAIGVGMGTAAYCHYDLTGLLQKRGDAGLLLFDPKPKAKAPKVEVRRGSVSRARARALIVTSHAVSPVRRPRSRCTVGTKQFKSRCCTRGCVPRAMFPLRAAGGGDVLSPDRTIPRSSELCGTGTSTAAWISSAMCFGRSERAGRGRRGKEPRIINSSLGKPRGHESLLAPPCHPPVPRHAAHSSARYHAPSAPVFVR